MNYIVKKIVNLSGQDLLLTPLDIDYHDRVVFLTGEITEETAVVVNAALHCLARDSGDISLYIQSAGGSVSAGLSIYDTIRAIPCDVSTVACGMTASMAAILLAAGTPGKRWVQPNAEVLIHQPLGGISGQASDMLIHAGHVIATRNRLNRILAEATGQTMEKIQADTERDRIMDAEAAVAYGLADRVGDPISLR